MLVPAGAICRIITDKKFEYIDEEGKKQEAPRSIRGVLAEAVSIQLQSFSVEWRALNADLTAVSDTGTVADGASGVVPFVSKSAMFNMRNLTRQFNPDVGYNDLTEALKTDAMRAGYFIDKALCSLPLHPLLTAGKTVQIEVSMQGSGGKAELSEMFSGNFF